MDTETRRKIVEATLLWCNERRAEKDEEPLSELPKGHREDPRSCPCGTATGLYVSHDTYDDRYSVRRPLPVEVTEFVSAFDSGLFPEFDLLADEEGEEV